MSWIDLHLHLPAEANVGAAARRAALRGLLGRGLSDRQWLAEAQLIVSELVTNAHRHAGGCVALCIGGTAAAVTVTVVDRSIRPPRLRTPDTDGGRGLHIIDRLSRGWGITRQDFGKQVWARLRPCPRSGAWVG